MKRVAITGRDHFYVTQLAQQLIEDERIELIVIIGKDLTVPIAEKVIYIDTLPYFPLSTIFSEHNIDTIVNLVKVDDETYSSREAYNLTLESLRNVIYSGARSGVENYLFYSSTVVYGTRKIGDTPFSPKRLNAPGSKFYYAKLRYDSEKIIYDFMDEFPHFNIKIARTPFTLGRNVDNLISGYLGLKFIPMISGYNPEFEFTHENDVVRGFHHLIFEGDTGIYNLSTGNSISLKEAALLMDKKLISVNKLIAKQFAYFSWLLVPNLLGIPPHGLDFLMYPFITDNKTLLESGFKFNHTIEDTIKEFKLYKQYL